MDASKDTMAVRGLCVQPAFSVSSLVSSVQPSISSCATILRTQLSSQRHQLLCCCGSVSESCSAFTNHERARAGRRSNIVGQFSRTGLNLESFGSNRTSRRTVFSMSSAGPSDAQTLSMEEQEFIRTEEKINSHQRAAARLEREVEARTVVDRLANGILSTISKKSGGYPVPSMVPYAVEESGTILLCVSGLSPHTVDLEANPKCALLVAKDLNDRSDLVVTLISEASDVPEHDIEQAKSTFLKKHPGAFWVDFGDFKMVRLDPKQVRCVSGIVIGTASVSLFSGELFKCAAIDPISQFSGPIAHHMNEDHADQTKTIVEKSVGVKVDSALITDVDSLGFYVLSQREGNPLRLRIPFPRKAESRKDVKQLIVELLGGGASPEK
ncbi:hypothetical protein R1sor_014169 [Riccia sorocarpa]|uniref:DUF2470 domain-containing protein n=1 Tax=Riccia sorocarpa TaxID=122646 RepID=A0ABD3HCD8_9MARC